MRPRQDMGILLSCLFPLRQQTSMADAANDLDDVDICRRGVSREEGVQTERGLDCKDHTQRRVRGGNGGLNRRRPGSVARVLKRNCTGCRNSLCCHRCEMGCIQHSHALTAPAMRRGSSESLFPQTHGNVVRLAGYDCWLQQDQVERSQGGSPAGYLTSCPLEISFFHHTGSG